MKYIYTLFFLLVTTFVSAQGRTMYAADQYFQKYGYVKSAPLYEKLYDKGNRSNKVLSRLGDCNYYNNNYKKAERWYKELFKTITQSEISNEHYYRYIQTLKSVGNYEKAKAILSLSKTYNKNVSIEILENESLLTPSVYNAITNLSINTSYSDYNNVLADGKLYFSSTRPQGSIRKAKTYGWNKQPYYTIYSANYEQDVVGKGLINLKDVSSLKGDVNGTYHDANPVFTNDGKVMYFTRDNSKGQKSIRTDRLKVSHLKLYKAELINGEWRNVKELPFNSKNYSVGHPFLSKDEQYLYFASDMPGGYGRTDLYKAKINDGGTFGSPQNLGEKINTAGKEMFPYIDSEKTLYFSSDGHIGLGGLDIFKSEEVSEGVYKSPENLRSPINTKSDDFSFVILKNKEKGYFSSNRPGGKGDDDIYSFGVANKADVNVAKEGVNNDTIACTKQIKGFVFDELTKVILPGAQVQLTNTSGDILKSALSDQKGFYDLGSVDCNEAQYKVVVSKSDYNTDSLVFGVNTDQKEPIELVAYLLQKEIKINTNNFDIHINPIYFDFDKFNIRADAARELNKVVKVMKDFPEIKLRIESHTDSRGNDAYNERLSDNRAKSSRDYIVSQGVKAERILSAKGFGEYRLLNECRNGVPCSVEEHQLNRRSYFYISNNPGHIKVKNQVGE